MSSHRDLKNAQQTLNEAVLNWICAEWGDPAVLDPPRYTECGALIRAYQEWNALRMQFDGDRPAAARDTSIAAAKTRPPLAGTLRRRVVEALVAHWKMYGAGMTTDLLEVRFKRSHQSVSSACNDMENKGWIVDSGVRLVTRSGCKAIAWKPTDLALGLVEGEH